MMKNIFVLGVIMIQSTLSYAEDPVSLRELSIDYKWYMTHSFDPIINANGLQNRAMANGLNLNMNLDVLTYGFIDTTVFSLTDQPTDNGPMGQFRSVGLNVKLGMRMTDAIDLYFEHRSQHVLDTTLPFPFPEQDGIAIKIYLINKNKHEGVF
jgi:hypothetical protein